MGCNGYSLTPACYIKISNGTHVTSR